MWEKIKKEVSECDCSNTSDYYNNYYLGVWKMAISTLREVKNEKVFSTSDSGSNHNFDI